MKKIAMLNCLKANEVCTGAGCFTAWNEKKKTFARYQDEEAELVAFLRCNGCGCDPAEDSGMQKKLQRLKDIGTQVVHVGVCTKNREGQRCPTIQKIIDQLEDLGIAWVDGTH